ncbi:MAG: L-threonylcarbamoyladenylate synthase [Lachnospiraceae bacterium]|nr:L-threonylcarbamoyladenylate synthase [Lachnospiraceae bacterium]MDY4068621.1 L-threonylcarbamoyladenylate synthase [Lachnospiraceae bacterium]
MNTKLVQIDENNIDQTSITEAGKILKSGGLVAFPTETVYGLGGDALQKESSRKIYAAKGRPSDNPLIVHICRWEDIGRIARNIPESAKKLADAFWPGPLTMILEKTDDVPRETTGGLDTVAVRMPNHKIALALIGAAGGYIAAPSANTSGKPSPTRAEHVVEDMQGRIELIIDGGSVGIGLESTIVDLTSETPVILRPGYITQDMLERVLGHHVDVDKTILDGNSKQAPKAPGMKYRHYAPKGDLTIVDGKSTDVVEMIRKLSAEKMATGERVGIICTDETRGMYNADCIMSVGARKDEASIARHLFAILRQFDEEQVTVIYSEAFSDRGLGQAIMNRLLKAAGHHVLYTDKQEGTGNDSIGM